MVAAPRAVPDDGHLDLVVMELTRSQVLGALLENYRGHFEAVPGVWQSPAHRLRVESPEALPVQADGEAVGTTPLIAEVVPGAFEVLVGPTG